MRAVIQVARDASVTISGQRQGGYQGLGLMVLVGVTHSDGPAQVAKIARKIATLRIMPGEKSAQELAAPVLVVSQFTLYADTRKGRRPTWNAAAPGEVSEPLYRAVVDALINEHGLDVSTGVFGADMDVSFTNVGPVTILLQDEAAD